MLPPPHEGTCAATATDRKHLTAAISAKQPARAREAAVASCLSRRQNRTACRALRCSHRRPLVRECLVDHCNQDIRLDERAAPLVVPLRAGL
jgi:hypothetical protein